MAYNPFAPAGSGGPADTKRYTKPARWPPLFETKLSSLEWSKGDGSARKRSRSETESENARSHSRPEKRQQPSASSNSAVSHPSARKSPDALVPQEPITIMGFPPLADDRVRYLVNFMLEHVTSPNVEIEAKLGLLIEKQNNTRAVDLVPVMCETPLRESSNGDTRFQSDVTLNIFQTLNAELNKRVNATQESARGRVEYLRTHEIDVYWPNKIRETRVAHGETYKTVRVQSKRRLADLNFLCPGSCLDVRYSASEEHDAVIPTNANPQTQRVKDRISYKFDYLSVDITMVKMSEHGGMQTTHEVEVEVDDPSELFKETCKYRDGDATSKLFDIAAALVNTVRLLVDEVRKAEVAAFENARQGR